jgi:hypothetical protein
MTRKHAFLMAAAFALSITGAPAMAEDHDLSFYTKDQLDKLCTDNGGTPGGNASLYGCKKACTGGTCGVICDAASKTCFGTTPDRRGPAMTGDRAVVGTLNAALFREQDDGNDHGRGRDGVPWGMLGLVGLAGLLGLRRPAPVGVSRG